MAFEPYPTTNTVPQGDPHIVEPALEYAGFWIRVGASLIDSVAVVAVTIPLLMVFYGGDYFSPSHASPFAGMADFLISWALPAAAVIAFWVYKQATPGKMVLSMRVVDARTGLGLSTGQAIARYLGYFVSCMPLGLGLIWVAFDTRKQGWHDKIAGTVVVRTQNASTRAVVFEPANHPPGPG